MSILATIIVGRTSEARYSVLHHLNDAKDAEDDQIQHSLALLNPDPALAISMLKWKNNTPFSIEIPSINEQVFESNLTDEEPSLESLALAKEKESLNEPELATEEMIQTIDPTSTITYEETSEVIDLEPVDNVESTVLTSVNELKKVKKKEKSKKFKLKDFSGISPYHQWLLTLKDANFEEKMAKQEEKARKKRIEKEAQKSVTKSDTIISESLADILAAQGHIEDAKKMYSQLMVKYPQKSSYFAAKINNI